MKPENIKTIIVGINRMIYGEPNEEIKQKLIDIAEEASVKYNVCSVCGEDLQQEWDTGTWYCPVIDHNN